MHPIFQNWRVFLLYLAAWVPLGAMLGLLISVAGFLSAAETAAIIVPVIALDMSRSYRILAAYSNTVERHTGLSTSKSRAAA